jgi:ABC-2 type transport system permease protein
MTSTTRSATDEPDMLRSNASALGDAWMISRRQFWHWRAQPGVLLVGLLFPVLVTLMFGALFGGAIAGPGTEYAGNYYAYLMPGIFTMAMLFGIESTMTAVNVDAAKGVTDRFRSLPISPAAVVLGRCIADMINSVVGLVVLVVAGLLLGWTWDNGLPAALAAFGLLLFLRFALLWVGIFIGLRVKGPESVSAVQIAVWPLSMLSNLFVDPATMPGWLGAIASWNPLSATASATRELFGNPGWDNGSWVAESALLLAVAWPVVISAVFTPLAVRAYRRLDS